MAPIRRLLAVGPERQKNMLIINILDDSFRSASGPSDIRSTTLGDFSRLRCLEELPVPFSGKLKP